MITPMAQQVCESPEKFKARKERNGYRNGTTYPSLESQIMYDPKFKGLLKTPSAIDPITENMKSKSISGTSGTLAQEIMSGYIEKRGLMLRTPSAQEPGVNVERLVTKDGQPARVGERAYDKETGRLAQVGLEQQVRMMLPTPRSNNVTDLDLNSESLAERGKHNLEESVAQMVISGILPTPTVNDSTNQTLPKSQEFRNDSIVKRILKDELGVSIPKQDGQPFRLSPLFTEEMMGFPFLWTTLPFLQQGGAPNPSKPTATPSSPK